MGVEFRRSFHRNLEDIERNVNVLFGMVTEGLAGATDALLSGDREAAEELAQRDSVVDRFYGDLDSIVERELSLQSPAASDLRFLLTMLRIVPELERSADLAEHIASRAAKGLGRSLTPRARQLIQRMGEVGVAMWRKSADAFTQRDPDAAAQLRSDDDELDALRTGLIEEVASADLPGSVAMELALVARFYERLGDHAVNIAERTSHMAARR